MYADTLCFPSSDEPCIQFRFLIRLATAFLIRGYSVYLDGQTVASGGDYGNSDGALFACAPGKLAMMRLR